jgi:TRAP-type C4-dicarboxylate transport system permease small subunit
MSPEEKELLNKSVALAEDNNRILHSMKHSMRFANIMSTIYWMLIIGSAVGAFYFLQPYIDEIVKTYGSVSAALKNFQK